MDGILKPKARRTPYERAVAKVDGSPTLRKYRAFILADWPEGDEHWRWVANAPVNEILAWAQFSEPQEQ